MLKLLLIISKLHKPMPGTFHVSMVTIHCYSILDTPWSLGVPHISLGIQANVSAARPGTCECHLWAHSRTRPLIWCPGIVTTNQ